MPKRSATSTRQLCCHGLFYDRHLGSGVRQRCRSQLVLQFCDTEPNNRTLLLFLMNPGASCPMNSAAARIRSVTHASQIPTHAVWLPTIPDATQAQTVLLMEALDCWRAIVVNLSDVCEPDSNALCQRVAALANNTPHWDSLFHALRHTELNNLLAARPYVAMIGGWGALRSRQACLRDAAGAVCARFQNIVGVPARSSYRNWGFLHPRPTANGGPKWRYYGIWRQAVASVLNLSQQIQNALRAKRKIDLLVDKDRIWISLGSGRLTIDLT